MQDQPRLYSVDMSRCAALRALDAAALGAMFSRALIGAGATVVHQASHEFPGAGVTCVLILAESHAVLHSWPETGTVNIDIFSCSTRLRSLAAIDELGRLLGAEEVVVQEILREDGSARRRDLETVSAPAS